MHQKTIAHSHALLNITELFTAVWVQSVAIRPTTAVNSVRLSDWAINIQRLLFVLQFSHISNHTAHRLAFASRRARDIEFYNTTNFEQNDRNRHDYSEVRECTLFKKTDSNSSDQKTCNHWRWRMRQDQSTERLYTRLFPRAICADRL